MKAYPMVPGMPAAGHISRGFWHPGRIDGCPKCPDTSPPLRDTSTPCRHCQTSALVCGREFRVTGAWCCARCRTAGAKRAHS